MARSTSIARFVLAAALMLFGCITNAYILKPTPPGNRLVMNLDLGSTLNNFLNGYVASWNTVFAYEMSSWNQTGIGRGLDHNFFSVRSPTSLIGDACERDGVNEVRWDSTSCGQSWGTTLAITYSWAVDGKVVEVGIIFNSNHDWNAYNGPLQPASSGGWLLDFGRVALHELGHAAGLLHPDDYGQNVVAIMNATTSDTYSLQQDDIDGVHAVAWGSGTPTTCTYALSDDATALSSATFIADGGTGGVRVTAASGCTWTAAVSAPWITLTSGESGNGNGTVNYAIGANTNNPSRTATITIAGQTFTVTQSGSTGVPKNYQGMWWAAPAGIESGWGINFAHQGDVIFATWFTHDLNGKAWNLSMTALQTGSNTFSGTLNATSGPPLGSVPFDPAQVQRSAVGSATLTFADGNNGKFAYTVNGISQTKPITRQVFGTLPTCVWGAISDLTLATNYTDMWWVPGGAESGWGINFAHEGDTLFATWFTYDYTGAALPMSATLTRIGTNVYSGALIRTSGPPFNAVPFNPDSVIRTTVGTATVTFANGNAATFSYQVNDGIKTVTQTKAIARQVFRAPGTTCQ